MTVQECSLKFTQLSKYAQAMMANSSALISKFVSSVLKLADKECKITFLILKKG